MARGPGPKLLTLVRRAIRLRHYSRHTEEAYVGWVRRFVRFCGTRHPRELGPAEVTRFLSSLAVDRRVSASTQNQALGALVFLYRDVLDAPVGWLAALVRAKRLSGDESVRRSTHRPAPPPSFTRNGRAA